jgi:hypothetical protein
MLQRIILLSLLALSSVDLVLASQRHRHASFHRPRHSIQSENDLLIDGTATHLALSRRDDYTCAPGSQYFPYAAAAQCTFLTQCVGPCKNGACCGGKLLPFFETIKLQNLVN